MNTKKILEAKRLYQQGMSYRSIGEKLGFAPGSVHYHLKKEGVVSRSPGKKGSSNFFWNGGVTIEKKKGRISYRLVYCPEHPHCNHQNKVREHRLVMEKMLGRYLTRDEVVDHIDGNGLNNAPENLRLYANNAAHLAATKKGCVPRWTEAGKKKMVARTFDGMKKARQLLSKHPRLTKNDVSELRLLRGRLKRSHIDNLIENSGREPLLERIRIVLDQNRKSAPKNHD